jgi:hypothetical protein
MIQSTKTDSECLNSVRELLWELATEIDLHYNPEDFPKLTSTVARMKKAVTLLQRESVKVKWTRVLGPGA